MPLYTTYEIEVETTVTIRTVGGNEAVASYTVHAFGRANNASKPLEENVNNTVDNAAKLIKHYSHGLAVSETERLKD